ncbi:MAG TPA: hypothetical protein VFW29_06455 [Solirubrobacteraceae bacterium]|nr:hypothetical protein [Solirubrobacteraceae bacterium]
MLVPLGIVLILAAGSTTAGVALLGVSLLIAATPISLVLRALAPPPEQDRAPEPGAPEPEPPREE